MKREKIIMKHCMLMLVMLTMILGRKMTALAVDATTIKVNTTISGNVERYRSIWYAFTATENGYFNVSLETVTFDPNDVREVWLVDSSGNTMESFRDGNQSTTWPCTKGIKYYICVASYAYKGWSDFKLRVNQTASSEYELEPNDTASNAQLLSWNKPKYGAFPENDGFDYYKVKVTQPGYFTISVKPKREGAINSSWTVDVYDEKNNNVCEIYRQNQGTTYRLSYDVGAVVYIKVAEFYSYKEMYEITAKFYPANNYETENNNSLKTADKVDFNKTYYGVIENPDMCDCFTFTNPATSKVTFSFEWSDVGNYGNSRMTLYDEKGHTKEYRFGHEKDSVDFMLKKGKYYLVIDTPYRSNSDCWKLYDFKLTRKTVELKSANTIKSISTVRPTIGFSQVNSTIRMKKVDAKAQYCELRVSKSKKMKKPTVAYVKRGKKMKVAFYSWSGTYYAQIIPYNLDAFDQQIYGKKSKVFKFKIKK